jgi:cobyrinic acid a,c-diamide synthase
VASFRLPRIVVAGLAGNAGKTLISIGLVRALRQCGLRVAAFKKGPDFIDAAWLGAAAGLPAHNLDLFLTSSAEIRSSLGRTSEVDIAVIEGNRGVFDGLDATGTYCTAELAKQIAAPLVLVVDVSKSTRTVAALVLGCRALDPELPLVGIILNRVATPRHERVIRDALALATDVPVLGAVSRLVTEHLPPRHLGLVMPGERQDCEAVIDRLAAAIAPSIDISAIRRLAEQAPALSAPDLDPKRVEASAPTLRIGILRDAAFCFYYPENLLALEQQGARLVPISPLSDRELPEIDALYAGGGYPEEHAAALAANVSMRTALAARIEAGLPVWAECGGLSYLARELLQDGIPYPMLGVLPVVVEQTKRPQAHGYVEALVDTANPFLATGTRLRGHEFHFSRLVTNDAPIDTMLSLERGVGIGSGRDGIVARSVFASYLHLFAPGVPEWAPAFVRVAREVKSQQLVTPTEEGNDDGMHCGRRHHDRGRRGWVHPGA